MNKLQTKIKKMKNKKGFTLIELIVVIVILGILAAIAIPKLSGFSDKAKAAACTANQKTMNTAMATVYAETGAYPAITDASFLAYMDKGAVPTCPSSGTYSVSNGKVVCSVATHPAP